MKVYIDNIPLQYPQDELLKPTFTLRKKDDLGNVVLSYTSNLVFIGADALYIKQKLIDDPAAITNKVLLKFVDDCCGNKVYEFDIVAESLNWCENECTIEAAAIEHASHVEQYACIQNTLIWDDWNNFTQKQHPRFSYCNELRPSWKHDVLLIMTILFSFNLIALAPVLAVLGVIVLAYNAVANAINSIVSSLNSVLPGSAQISININTIDFDNDPSTNIFQEMLAFGDNLLTKIVGCGRKHPSPLVRDYADNVCGKCGIQFQSSIFKNGTSAYYNTCWHEAPVDKGINNNDTTTYWIDRNKPLLNGVLFFDKLKAPFNANWQIRNNILTFERRDFFAPQTPWLDLTILQPEDYTLCWSWSKKPRYSYGNFTYQKDAINSVGNEANDRWSDIVEWNNPYSPLQKGEYAPLIEFATCRFRDDGIDRDVLSSYENAPFIGNIIQQYDGSILLNQHLSYTPMLLIWDPTSGLSNAKVSGSTAYFPNLPNNASHNQNVGASIGVNQFYNYPMWFQEGCQGNLYTEFHFINNPHYSLYQGYDYTASEIELTCERRNAVDLYGMIKTQKGNAEIAEIVLNFATETITINGSI